MGLSTAQHFLAAVTTSVLFSVSTPTVQATSSSTASATGRTDRIPPDRSCEVGTATCMEPPKLVAATALAQFSALITAVATTVLYTISEPCGETEVTPHR